MLQPVNRLAFRVNPMAFPVNPMAFPVNRLEHPVNRLEHPVNRLGFRVNRLEHPVNRMAFRVNPMEHPVNPKRWWECPLVLGEGRVRPGRLRPGSGRASALRQRVGNRYTARVERGGQAGQRPASVSTTKPGLPEPEIKYSHVLSSCKRLQNFIYPKYLIVAP